MAYNKKTWVTGETIEASALNNMENGIEAGQNDDLEKEIEQNTSDIATNKASIEQNASDIATNKASIEQNANDISTNKASIEQNASDIETNKANIEQNASDITELNSALTDLLIVRTIMATSVSCEGSSTCNYTFSDSAIAHSGYTPLGIVGFYANSSQANIYRCNYSSENGLVFGFRNLSSSTINPNIYVYMLYIKS